MDWVVASYSETQVALHKELTGTWSSSELTALHESMAVTEIFVILVTYSYVCSTHAPTNLVKKLHPYVWNIAGETPKCEPSGKEPRC